ncbi:MAG: (d)CMP kinase [Terricaulis sp.]
MKPVSAPAPRARRRSKVAAIPAVRAALLDASAPLPANPAERCWMVAISRPSSAQDADVKLFVTASLAARTERRLKELRARGETISFEALERQIAERDERDASRADAPLRQALDAHLLDTTSLSIEGAVEAACRIIDAATTSRPRG